LTQALSASQSIVCAIKTSVPAMDPKLGSDILEAARYLKSKR
jgi:hypothetical protein